MRIGVRIPPCAPLARAVDAMEAAENAGFDTISVPHSPTLARDTFMTFALATRRTSRCTLATSVVNFVTADPIALASAASTLSDLAPGRVRIGIGAGDSSAFLTGRNAGTTSQLREGFAAITGLMSGDEVTIRGRPV